MTRLTLSELREFLSLGARAVEDNIPRGDVERQERSVLRAMRLLDEQPGVVLADEVGMGKTYEALGVVAAFFERKRKAKIVVITPGPDLTIKWGNEFARFKEMYDFEDVVTATRRLGEFVEALREPGPCVVVAPITMFQSGKGSLNQTQMMELYFYWRKQSRQGFRGKTAQAIMHRILGDECERMHVGDHDFLGKYGVDDIESYLTTAFKTYGDGDARPLDRIYEDDGIDGFGNKSATKQALYQARFKLTNRLLPKIDLLIVDEAHKLKNSDSLRTKALRTTFRNKFGKSLFLTATPFQLDVQELKQIFGLFGLAKGAPEDHQDEVDTLLASVQEYQERYDQFQHSWSRLDHGLAALFSKWFLDDPSLQSSHEDVSVQSIGRHVSGLLQLKNKKIEPGFRKWMIRSLRPEKREYRSHSKEDIKPKGEAVLPFLLYERFIAEIFRRKERTHKAAAEINMVSSYAAASRGENIANERGVRRAEEIEEYRGLLANLLEDLHKGDARHPKLKFQVDDVFEAADRGEKTLVFCSRIATLEELRRQIDARWDERILAKWQRIYPKSTEQEIFDHTDTEEKRRKGRHSLLQARFHRSQDALSLVLREHYLRTAVPIHSWAMANLQPIVEAANRKLDVLRLDKTSAARRDYLVAKRCVEQAAVELWCRDHDQAEHDFTDSIEAILDVDFLSLGFDLEQDELESSVTGELQPTWTIDEKLARVVIGGACSLWEHVTEELNGLDRPTRVHLVEQVARYLTYRQVPFLADLLVSAEDAGLTITSINSAELASHVHSFWDSTAGTTWKKRVVEFVRYFLARAPSEQISILDGPVKNVKFARHTIKGASREKIREAFNTPFFPMVLIANEVMQEGIDLHKNCRRIVHHDLAWNPAQIEQRIGRIDRLGSLTAQLRETKPETTLDVLYPLICLASITFTH